jgi:hypothetical protein
MNRDRLAKGITIALILGAVAFFVARRSGARAQTAETKRAPQDAIYAMLEAARAGNPDAYLSEYTGQMQASLKQVVLEKGTRAFAEYLRSSSAALRGVAIDDPANLSDHEAQVRLEYIYQDRNEAQLAYLEKVAGEWKIARIDATERVKTLVPYGTPVQ